MYVYVYTYIFFVYLCTCIWWNVIAYIIPEWYCCFCITTTSQTPVDTSLHRPRLTLHSLMSLVEQSNSRQNRPSVITNWQSFLQSKSKSMYFPNPHRTFLGILQWEYSMPQRTWNPSMHPSLGDPHRHLLNTFTHHPEVHAGTADLVSWQPTKKN